MSSTVRQLLRRTALSALLAGLCIVMLVVSSIWVRLGGVVVFATAIVARESRRRRAFQEARAIGDDLRLAVDTIPTIVWITEPDGTVSFMNRAWRKFTGLSVDDVSRGRWVETLHPDEMEMVQSTRNAAVAAGKAYELDARLRRADGSYRWVLRRAVPLRNARGEIVRWYGTGTDIDDLKRAQRAVRRARERAITARFSAALDERTRLAREIHDTLLQGFTGVALQLTAMERRLTDPVTARELNEVVGQAQRALDEARQAVWDLRETTSPTEGFVASVREVAIAAIRGTALKLEFDMRGVEKPLASRVQSVATRVLEECVANVIKHAEARSLQVHVSYGERAFTLRVADDGRGFEWDPTFRAYGAHWGLLGMKERASELRGVLSVRTASGRGTTVVLRLPYRARSAPVLA